jgi:hypothetical protein
LLKRAQPSGVNDVYVVLHSNGMACLLTLTRVFSRSFFVAGALALSVLLSAPPRAFADARSDYLVQLLVASSQFRVRAQAAISLGSVHAEGSVVDALGRALRDEHPAVRAAAANSLGRLAEPSALAALRAASGDAEEPVRTAAKAAVARIESSQRSRAGSTVVAPPTPRGPARYYVAVGQPASRAAGITDTDLLSVHGTMKARVQELDGVVLAPQDESSTAAQQVLRSRQLKGFYIESSVTSIENKADGGVRAVVSVVVATYPGRDMRAVMQGAATALGGGDIKSQAIEAAFRSALRQLPQALVRE